MAGSMAGKECEILVIRHACETACPPCRPRAQPPRRALVLAVNRRRAGQGPRFRSSRRPERGMPLRPSLVASQASFPSRIRAATDAPRILDQPGRKASAPRTGPRIRDSPNAGEAKRQDARLRSACLLAKAGPDHSGRPRQACAQGNWLPRVRGEGAVREIRFGFNVGGCRRPPADRRPPASCTPGHLLPAGDMPVPHAGWAPVPASDISLT